MYFAHWATKSQLTLGLSRAHFPQLEGRSAGRRKQVCVRQNDSVLWISWPLTSFSYPPTPLRLSYAPLHPPPTTLIRGEDSLWCVFYVKSMVSGQCESKSKPVVKTNFIYHRRVPCIIITPAQQLALWIHNQTKVGRTKCSKVAIQISNMTE